MAALMFMMEEGALAGAAEGAEGGELLEEETGFGAEDFETAEQDAENIAQQEQDLAAEEDTSTIQSPEGLDVESNVSGDTARASNQSNVDRALNEGSQNAFMTSIIGQGMISDSFNLATTIMGAVEEKKDTKESMANELRQRHRTGILLKGEDRNKLAKDGELPPIFTDKSIKNLLKAGRLPPGWTTLTAITQGYGGLVNKSAQANQHANVQRQQEDYLNTRKITQQLHKQLGSRRYDLNTRLLIDKMGI